MPRPGSVQIKYVSFLGVGSKGWVRPAGQGTPSIFSFGPYPGQLSPEQNTLSGLARGNPMGGGFIFDVYPPPHPCTNIQLVWSLAPQV